MKRRRRVGKNTRGGKGENKVYVKTKKGHMRKTSEVLLV